MILYPTYDQYLDTFQNYWQGWTSHWQRLMCRIFLCRHFHGGLCIFARKRPLNHNEYELRTDRLYENELFDDVSEKNIVSYYETAKEFNPRTYNAIFLPKSKKGKNPSMKHSLSETYTSNTKGSIATYHPTDKEVSEDAKKSLDATEDLGIFSDDNLDKYATKESVISYHLYREIYPTPDPNAPDSVIFLKKYKDVSPTRDQIKKYFGYGEYIIDKTETTSEKAKTVSTKHLTIQDTNGTMPATKQPSTNVFYRLSRLSHYDIHHQVDYHEVWIYNQKLSEDQISDEHGAGYYLLEKIVRNTSTGVTTVVAFEEFELTEEESAENSTQDTNDSVQATTITYEVSSVVWTSDEIIRTHKGSYASFPTKAQIQANYGNGTYVINTTEYNLSNDESIVLESKTVYIQPNTVSDGDTKDAASPLSFVMCLLYRKAGPAVTHPYSAGLLERTYPTPLTRDQIKNKYGPGEYIIERHKKTRESEDSVFSNTAIIGVETFIIEDDSVSAATSPKPKQLIKKQEPPKPVKPDQIYFLKASMRNKIEEPEEDYDEIVL